MAKGLHGHYFKNRFNSRPSIKIRPMKIKDMPAKAFHPGVSPSTIIPKNDDDKKP